MEEQSVVNILLQTMCKWNSDGWSEEVHQKNRCAEDVAEAHKARLRHLQTAIRAGAYNAPSRGAAEGFLCQAFDFARSRHT